MYVESVVCPATQIDAFSQGSRSLGFGALALRANTICEPVVFLCVRAFSQRIYSKAEAGKVLVSRFLVEFFLKRFLNLFFPNFTHMHATTPLLFLGGFGSDCNSMH